jgi:hypothetical protein
MVTQADIDQLNSAIASGRRSVTLGGQSITYATVDALIKARTDLQKQLDAANGVVKTRRFKMYHAGRGYE